MEKNIAAFGRRRVGHSFSKSAEAVEEVAKCRLYLRLARGRERGE